MTAITFLRSKGILKPDWTKLTIKVKNSEVGCEFDLVELLNQYAQIKSEEVNPVELNSQLVDVRHCPHQYCQDVENCNNHLKCQHEDDE